MAEPNGNGVTWSATRQQLGAAKHTVREALHRAANIFDGTTAEILDKDDGGKPVKPAPRTSRAVLQAAVVVLLVAAAAGFTLFGIHSAQAGPGISRKIHFTWKDKNLPEDLQANVDSWTAHNPWYSVVLWNDESMRKYVASHYGSFLDAYDGLAKAVERADFFRYLLLYREGGVWSDLDVKCLQPVESYIRRGDGLVVGWRGEWLDEDACEMAQVARKRMLAHWVLVAPARHPALAALVTHVMDYYNTTFSPNSARDTTLKTGAGAFTDVVLRWARQNLPPQAAQWGITFLPRAVWGSDSGSHDGALRAAEHTFMASWQHEHEVSPFGGCSVDEIPIAPVTIDWQPRFSVMTHLSGVGDADAGGDPSSSINNYGNWQPGLPPTARPSVLQVLGAVMQEVARSGSGKATFVDVGAGYGLYSLGMAALGYNVIAFEKAPKSEIALAASIDAAGWEERVELRSVALGERDGTYCAARKFPGGSVEEQRGYSRSDEAFMSDCFQQSSRLQSGSVLGGVRQPWALRINAAGWEPAIVAGMVDVLQGGHRPLALLLVWQQSWMEEVGEGSAAAMVETLRGAGYTSAVRGSEAECEEGADWGAGVFGMAASEGSVRWCELDDPTGLLDRQGDETATFADPKHLLLLHESLHVRQGHYRLDGLGLAP